MEVRIILISPILEQARYKADRVRSSRFFFSDEEMFTAYALDGLTRRRALFSCAHGYQLFRPRAHRPSKITIIWVGIRNLVPYYEHYMFPNTVVAAKGSTAGSRCYNARSLFTLS